MDITLVSPPTLIDPRHVMTSGIHRFPMLLAVLAAVLERYGHTVTVVDSLGLAPHKVRPWRERWIHGLSPEETATETLATDPGVVFVMADSITAHDSTVASIGAIHRVRPDLPLGVLENTQSVTGYSLRRMLPDFFRAGASHVITGETEERVPQLVNDISRATTIDGVFILKDNRVHGRPAETVIDPLDSLPWPDWSKIPLKGHWSLGYAHGPTERNLLPILTSRGCPFPCKFCVVPETGLGQWRARSAWDVVHEIVHGIHTWGVREFHMEDLNMSLDEDRLRTLSTLILEQKLGITWRIVSGAKLDPIKRMDTFELMAASGCDYFSFSPESGSARVLAAMKKNFHLVPTLESVRQMARAGIRTQGCFVLGFPGETDDDLRQTERTVRSLVRAGLDETAFFVATPIPGAALRQEDFIREGTPPPAPAPLWAEGGAPIFSPPAGPNGARLRQWRRRLYLSFVIHKTRRRPLEILAQIWRFLRRRFKTKMEMAPYRAMALAWKRFTAEPWGERARDKCA